MPRGGPRPGAGRKAKTEPAAPKVVSTTPAQTLPGMSPLEYMLGVMRGEIEGDDRRDRMAVAAAPYCHGKVAESAGGKKGQRQERAEQSASGGRFKVPTAPKIAVDNTR